MPSSQPAAHPTLLGIVVEACDKAHPTLLGPIVEARPTQLRPVVDACQGAPHLARPRCRRVPGRAPPSYILL